jgi:hypothetical protein
MPGLPNVLPRRGVDAPTLLLAAGWLGLWLLWPGARPEAPEPPARRGGTAFSFRGAAVEHAYMRPDLFGRPSAYGFRAADLPEEDMRALSSRPAVTAGVLPWRDTAAPSSEGAAAAGGAQTAPDYRPVWDDAPPFTPPAAADMQMTVQLSPDLVHRGYKMAAVPPEAVRKSGKSWLAVFSVEMRADGNVAHVFVEKGSGDSARDGSLVRALYEGRAAERPGSDCLGEVTVSFGRK